MNLKDLSPHNRAKPAISSQRTISFALLGWRALFKNTITSCYQHVYGLLARLSLFRIFVTSERHNETLDSFSVRASPSTLDQAESTTR